MGPPASPAQAVPDLRHQQRWVDWLGDVVVAAAGVAGLDVLHLAAGGDHDHGDGPRGWLPAQLAHRFQARHLRHHHVHEDEIGPFGERLGHTFFAVGGCDALEGLLLQDHVLHEEGRLRVVDEENLLPVHRPCLHGSGAACEGIAISVPSPDGVPRRGVRGPEPRDHRANREFGAHGRGARRAGGPSPFWIRRPGIEPWRRRSPRQSPPCTALPAARDQGTPIAPQAVALARATSRARRDVGMRTTWGRTIAMSATLILPAALAAADDDHPRAAEAAATVAADTVGATGTATDTAAPATPGVAKAREAGSDLIYSVDRTPERAFDAPRAADVITADDIRRRGARTL